MSNMDAFSLRKRSDELQKKFSRDVKMVNGVLTHISDGGTVEEYTQNPPSPRYLYGCPLCGSYFETDIKQDA
jgi:hypothetical protein